MLEYITGYLKSTVTPGQAGNYFWVTVYVLVIFALVSLCVMIMNWGERKALAHFQVRLGPMRVGPHGLLQPIADAVKLMTKEDIMPLNADKLAFWMAPYIILVAAFTTYTVIPFGKTHAVTDMNIGILFILGISSIGVLGIVLAGWASNSHYPLLGSLRSSAQLVSYEVAMGLAVVSAILMTSMTPATPGTVFQGGNGTLSMINIVEAQRIQGVWFIFKFYGLGLIAFVIFAIAMIAETNRAPFDLPEAESELVAGFHTEYSGFRWSLFMLGEYAAMIAVSSVATTLWLGGWMRPFPNMLSAPIWDTIFKLFPGLTFLILAGLTFFNVRRMPKHPSFKLQTLGLAAFGAVLGIVGLILLIPPVANTISDIYWFALKVAVFMYLYIWYRATWPRYRFDQLMRVGWKVLLPISLGVLILTAVVGVLG